MSMSAFAPLQGGTKSISASTTSASATLDANAAGATSLLIAVEPSQQCFMHVVTSDAAITATTAHMAIAIGATVSVPDTNFIISKPPTHTVVSVILTAGTATVKVTPGDGKF